MNSRGGAEGLASVLSEFEDAVVKATEECPGECIFIERD
jgi:ferredoxin